MLYCCTLMLIFKYMEMIITQFSEEMLPNHA